MKTVVYICILLLLYRISLNLSLDIRNGWRVWLWNNMDLWASPIPRVFLESMKELQVCWDVAVHLNRQAVKKD